MLLCCRSCGAGNNNGKCFSGVGADLPRGKKMATSMGLVVSKSCSKLQTVDTAPFVTMDRGEPTEEIEPTRSSEICTFGPQGGTVGMGTAGI